MKKILIVLALIVSAFSGMTQGLEGIVGLKMLESDTVIANNQFSLNGNIFYATTQTNPSDTILATEAFVSAGGASGVSVLSFDKETGIGSISTATILVDTASFEGRWGFLTTDTLIVRNDSLLLGNGVGIPILDITGPLDGKYVEIADSSNYPGYVTNTAIDDSLSNYATTEYVDSITVNSTKNVYHITMPYSTSVMGRIGLTTDLPQGWALTADGLNLIVTHNLGRRVSSVTVWANMGSGREQELYDTNRYTLIETLDANNCKIFSLSLSPTEIIIRISFE